MSSLSLPASGSASASRHPRLREAVIAGAAVATALLVLYAVFLDQGALLSPFLGETAWSANYVHEFAHDGRHLLGAPCH